MSLPYALMPVCRQQFLDANAVPYAAGTLYFYVAGTSTPKAVYSDSTGTVSLGTSVTLDSGGYAPAIYLAPGGYKVILHDVDATMIWTQDVVEDVGLTFFDSLGEQLLTGSVGVTSGYEVLATDLFITVASTGGANPCLITLPPADEHPQPLCVKNLGNIAVALVPNGGDTIEAANEAWTIPAKTSTTNPTVWLMADGGSAWWIVSSFGF